MLYEQLYIRYNGNPLAENTTVETNLEADHQDVATTIQGWNGITPAPITRTVSANNVIPITGAEVAFEEAFLASQEVTLMLTQGATGKTCTTTGYLRSVNISAGVGQTTTLSFSFTGKPSKFE